MFSLCFLLHAPVNVYRHSFKHHKLRYTHHLLARELCFYYYRQSWTPLIPNHNKKPKTNSIGNNSQGSTPVPIQCIAGETFLLPANILRKFLYNRQLHFKIVSRTIVHFDCKESLSTEKKTLV